jgi:hypothetical protein
MTCRSCKGFNIKIEDTLKHNLLNEQKSANSLIKEATLKKAMAGYTKAAIAEMVIAFFETIKEEKTLEPKNLTKVFNISDKYMKEVFENIPKYIKTRVVTSEGEVAMAETSADIGAVTKIARDSFYGFAPAASYKIAVDSFILETASKGGSSPEFIPTDLPGTSFGDMREVKLPVKKLISEQDKFDIMARHSMLSRMTPDQRRALKKGGRQGIHILFDVLGVIDPFGVFDGLNVVLYLQDYYATNLQEEKEEAAFGAAMSAMGAVMPYVGDLLKLGKLGVRSKLAVPLIKKMAAKSPKKFKDFFDAVIRKLSDPKSVKRAVQGTKVAGKLGRRGAINLLKDTAARRVGENYVSETVQQAVLYGMLSSEKGLKAITTMAEFPEDIAKKVASFLYDQKDLKRTLFVLSDSEFSREFLAQDPVKGRTILSRIRDTLIPFYEKVEVELRKRAEKKAKEQKNKPLPRVNVVTKESRQINIKIADKTFLSEGRAANLRRLFKKLSDVIPSDKASRVMLNDVRALKALKPSKERVEQLIKKIDTRLSAKNTDLKKSDDYIDGLRTKRADADSKGLTNKAKDIEAQINSPALQKTRQDIKTEIDNLNKSKKELKDINFATPKSAKIKISKISKLPRDITKAFFKTVIKVEAVRRSSKFVCSLIADEVIAVAIANRLLSVFGIGIAAILARPIRAELQRIFQAQTIKQGPTASIKRAFYGSSLIVGCLQGTLRDIGTEIQEVVVNNTNLFTDIDKATLRIAADAGVSLNDIQKAKLSPDLDQNVYVSLAVDAFAPFYQPTYGAIADQFINDYGILGSRMLLRKAAPGFYKTPEAYPFIAAVDKLFARESGFEPTIKIYKSWLKRNGVTTEDQNKFIACHFKDVVSDAVDQILEAAKNKEGIKKVLANYKKLLKFFEDIREEELKKDSLASKLFEYLFDKTQEIPNPFKEDICSGINEKYGKQMNNFKRIIKGSDARLDAAIPPKKPKPAPKLDATIPPKKKKRPDRGFTDKETE